jgi:putative endonuclease
VTFSDIRIEKGRAGKANNFVILSHWKSQCVTGCHSLFQGFDSPRLHQSSFATKRRTKTATAKPMWGEAGLPAFILHDCELRLGKPGKSKAMKGFHYVYILSSDVDASRHYTGLTEDLAARLKAHNSGQVPHTAKYRPWKTETVIAFRSRKKAADFEKYLKSHSGRAFASKHF